MALSLGAQARQLLLALGLGLALGLLYDALRPLRRRLSPLFAGGLDLLFSLAAGAACFLYAMSAGEGRMGLWNLTAALAGFLLYLYLLSPAVLSRETAAAKAIFKIIGSCKKNLK